MINEGKNTEVLKEWGYERIIVNNELYCGKLLYLDKGAISSLHYHKKKQETFYCLSGQVALYIEDKGYTLFPFSYPITIYPSQKHQFQGLSDDIVILEISSHHSEDDVVRFSSSQPKPQVTE